MRSTGDDAPAVGEPHRDGIDLIPGARAYCPHTGGLLRGKKPRAPGECRLHRGSFAMIAFINGPFGVGKTTTAKLLARRLPNAMLYDPEEVGYLLHNVLSPVEERRDFQDYALWPRLVVEFAERLIEEYGRDLVIPMSIWNRERFEDIVSGLERIDSNLHLFRLTASEDELRRRILARPDEEGNHGWCLSHVESGLEAARNPSFGREIRTDERMPEEVAEEILSSITMSFTSPSSK